MTNQEQHVVQFLSSKNIHLERQQISVCHTLPCQDNKTTAMIIELLLIIDKEWKSVYKVEWTIGASQGGLGTESERSGTIEVTRFTVWKAYWETFLQFQFSKLIRNLVRIEQNRNSFLRKLSECFVVLK